MKRLFYFGLLWAALYSTTLGQFTSHSNGWQPINNSDRFGMGDDPAGDIILKVNGGNHRKGLYVWTGGSPTFSIYGRAEGSEGKAIVGVAPSGYAGWFNGEVRVMDPGGNALHFEVKPSGEIGMGTAPANDPDYRLYVQDGIQTGRVKTKASLADYVFQPDYAPMPLTEVEQYVWQHHHLPGVISQAEVDEAGGVELTAFTVQLQEKLEELYLHTIEQEKRIAELERRLAEETEISERAKTTERAEISEIAEKTEGAEISETLDATQAHPTPAQPQEQK